MRHLRNFVSTWPAYELRRVSRRGIARRGAEPAGQRRKWASGLAAAARPRVEDRRPAPSGWLPGAGPRPVTPPVHDALVVEDGIDSPNRASPNRGEPAMPLTVVRHRTGRPADPEVAPATGRLRGVHHRLRRLHVPRHRGMRRLRGLVHRRTPARGCRGGGCGRGSGRPPARAGRSRPRCPALPSGGLITLWPGPSAGPGPAVRPEGVRRCATMECVPSSRFPSSTGRSAPGGGGRPERGPGRRRTPGRPVCRGYHHRRCVRKNPLGPGRAEASGARRGHAVHLPEPRAVHRSRPDPSRGQIAGGGRMELPPRESPPAGEVRFRSAAPDGPGGPVRRDRTTTPPSGSALAADRPGPRRAGLRGQGGLRRQRTGRSGRRPPGRPRLVRKEFAPAPSGAGLVVGVGLGGHRCPAQAHRSRGSFPARVGVWELLPVPDRLSHRSTGGAGGARCPSVPGLVGAGAGVVSRRAPASPRGPDLRLRRVPTGLPHQPGGRPAGPPTPARSRQPSPGSICSRSSSAPTRS